MSNSNGWKFQIPGVGAIAAALGLGLMLAAPSPASAQAAYGSYIGGGIAVGVTDGPDGDGGNTGGLIAIRYKFLEIPVSLRGQALIGDTTAFVPTISYDIPLSWQADIYLGAGAAIQDSDENSSPIGNQTSFVLQPGIDYALPDSNLVVFGNAIIAFDAYKESSDTAASIQGGLGVRF